MSERDAAVEAIVDDISDASEMGCRLVQEDEYRNDMRRAVEAGRKLGIEEGRSINLLETHGGIGNAMRDAKTEGAREGSREAEKVFHKFIDERIASELLNAKSAGAREAFELCALLMEAFPGPYDIDRAEAAAAIRARSEVKP